MAIRFCLAFVLTFGSAQIACSSGSDVPAVAKQRADEMCACQDRACVDAVETKYRDRMDALLRVKNSQARKRLLVQVTRAIDCGAKILLRDRPKTPKSGK